MKRKLIKFEDFKQIKENSLSTAEAELKKAEPVLAKALDVTDVNLHCFGKNNVAYETTNNSYIHATYRMAGNHIIFENIEELIIDEATARQEARNILGTMVEELMDENETKAAESFKKYISIPTVRRGFKESTEKVVTKKPKQDTAKLRCESFKNKFESVRFKAPKKKIKEWAKLSENVINYVDFQEFGPTMKDSEVKRDDKGNVVAMRIPNSQARNEGKVLTLNFKNMLDTEVKVLRGKMKGIHESSAFCHAMSDLRKTNAISDEAGMQQVLEAIVTKWPDLIYLSHGELSKHVAAALENSGDTNWDDEMCEFLAEGILRTAVSAYSERVNRIARMSGNELNKETVYESFQDIVSSFYAKIDEGSKLEMQVYVDLYNTLVEIHNFAKTEKQAGLQTETNNFLKELYSVLHEESEPSLTLAEEVATWLAALVEANMNWDVSNAPYNTVNGDNPQMAKNAAKGYTPSNDFEPNPVGAAPVSDGKSYKGGLDDEMRNNAWGNYDVSCWPNLENPYLLKAVEPKMKGKPENDGDNDWSRYQSDSTWPNLKNPAVLPPTDNWRMKGGDDLVIDK